MLDSWSAPITVQQMYGDWDYETAVEVLERSLEPRPSTSLFDTIGDLGVGPDDVVLDIGGRDGRHSLLMAERFGCRAVSVDPVEANIADGMQMLAAHDHGDAVELRIGTIEDIPAEDDAFDLVLCRDVLAHLSDLDRALSECTRILKSDGLIVVHGVFATPLLEPREAQELCSHTAAIPERMSSSGFEDAVAAAGLEVQDLEVIGSEWHEASQESGAAPNYLLQVSRLRRAREAMIEELGEVPYRVMYGNALWSIYHALGKLESRVYVLRRS